jgi:hypothetical protein
MREFLLIAFLLLPMCAGCSIYGQLAHPFADHRGILPAAGIHDEVKDLPESAKDAPEGAPKKARLGLRR